MLQKQKSNIGHWIVDHNNNHNSWSDELYEILELNNSEVEPSQETLISLIHPDDKTNALNHLNNITKQGKSQTIYYQLQLKNNQSKKISHNSYTHYNTDQKPLQTIHVLQDITLQKNPKEELKKSENIFRSIFDHSPIAIALIDENLIPQVVNNQFCNLLGFNADELMQKSIKDLTYPKDFDNNKLLYNNLFKGKIGSFTISKRYYKKNSETIWVKVTVTAISNQNKGTKLALAMIQNISAEKKATAELIKSEYKYRTLIENANDGIGMFSLSMKPLFYNTSLYEMLGYNLSEYLKFDHNNYELFHPDDREEAKKAINKAQQNQKARIEKRLINKNGHYKHYSISYIPVVHEEKPAILVFRRDISKRKQAEEQNEEYRLFLETIMENLPVALFAKTTPDFRYLYWNKAMELITGISAENAIGNTDNELLQLRTKTEDSIEEDKKVLKTRRKIEKEHVFTNIIGEEKQIKTIKTLHEPPTGNPIILGISMDITELKNIEKHVEQSNELLKEAQKITKLGYWEYDTQKDLVIDNKENRQIFGTINRNYFLNRNQLLDIILPSDHPVLEKEFRECIQEKKPGESVVRINFGNKIKHISLNYKPLFDKNNEVIKLRGTSLDISRIRESEIALRESEARLKQAEHIAKVGYWNYDYITNRTVFSDEVSNILEFPLSENDIEFSQLFHSVLPEDRVATATVFHKSKGAAKPFNFDFRIRTPERKIKYIRAKGTFVKNSQGQLIRSIGTFQDISELKKQQIKLEKSSSRLQTIQKLSRTGFIEFGLNSSSAFYSDSLLNILNTKKALKTVTDFDDFIHEDDKAIVTKQLNKTLENKSSHNIQYRIKLENGTIKFVNEIGNTIKQTNPTRYYINRIIQDISYIKAKETALSKSESHLLQAVKNNQIGIWEYNTSTENYMFSHEVIRILNLSQKYENIAFKSVLDRIHPKDQFTVKHFYSKSFKSKENYAISYRIKPFNSDKFIYVKDTGRFIKNELGQWIIAGTIRDISETKIMRKQLSEATVLIKSLIEPLPFEALGFIQNNKVIYTNANWRSLFNYSSNKQSEIETAICKKVNELIENEIVSGNTLKIGSLNIKADYSITQFEYNEKPASIIKIILSE